VVYFENVQYLNSQLMQLFSANDLAPSEEQLIDVDIEIEVGFQIY
jgi:hypothetical protein